MAVVWKNLAYKNDNVTSKTTTATLTVAEAGIILVSAASAYTITLPTASGNTGLTYHFIKTDANYNVITLDGNDAETIGGSATYTLLNTPQAKVGIVSDGTNWQIVNEDMGIVPRCSVYLDTLQEDIANTTDTKVLLNNEIYDIGANFDSTTNYRFVAPIPGYYQVCMAINYYWNSVVGDKVYATKLFLNGAFAGQTSVHSAFINAVSPLIVTEVLLAATDFVEVYSWHGAGVGTVDIMGNEGTYLTVALATKT